MADKLAAWLVVGLLASAASNNIVNLDQLNAAIESGSNKKVAFLTQANYDAVHTVLSDQAEVVICDGNHGTYSACDSTAEMIKLITDGTILAGHISGLPDAASAPSLNAFTSTIISLRAMLMAPAKSSETPHGPSAPTLSAADLALAVDAAIVALQANAKDDEARQNNQPFEFMKVHTCRTDDPALFVVPNSAAAAGLLRKTLDEKVLKVGALGMYDWAQDGDYTVDPPTGFYPDWLTAFCESFNGLAGPDGVRYDSAGKIACERTYQPSSSLVFRDILDGNTYVTEPYYVVDAFYSGTDEACSIDNASSVCRPANLPNERETCTYSMCIRPDTPRVSHFRLSCSTLGIDSTFMTKKMGSSASTPDQASPHQAPYNVDTLNAALSECNNKKVAFLSKANYDTVQTTLVDDVTVVICDGTDAAYPNCKSTADMIQHILNGSFMAGLISGLPEAQYEPQLNAFTSTLVSLRAMLMSPPNSLETPHGALPTSSKSSEDLSAAVDAAIASLQAEGLDEQARHDNMPFEFMAVHTCRTVEPDLFTVPNAADATGLLRTTLDDKILKIGALGQYNWAQDGDYTVDPPTGFYPDWLAAFCVKFNSLQGPDGVRYDASGRIVCERVYQPGSAGVFKDLFDGLTYVTEPYYTVDSFYYGTNEICATDNDCRVSTLSSGYEICSGEGATKNCVHPASPRTRHFRLSCSTFGIDSTFMVSKNLPSSITCNAPPSNEVSGSESAGAVQRLMVAMLVLLVSLHH